MGRAFFLLLEVHMDALFTAVDFSGLQGNVQTLLVGFVGILCLFVGYRYLKRATSAA